MKLQNHSLIHETWLKYRGKILVYTDKGFRYPATTVYYKIKELSKDSEGRTEFILQILNDDKTPTPHTQPAYAHELGTTYTEHN